MKINATEFKAKCLKLMDEVAKTHEPVIVTKRGKPIAKLVPVEPEEEKQPNYFGCMAGTIKITGDIMVPIEGEDWEAALGEEAHFYEGLGVVEGKPDEDEQ
ncbi:type II toxin-antitoxin system Phd/YefM family antitoxin [Thiolapillus sp.]|uniref:type II toxin-antitoxin system Phd/YefM family antitoxin n=1 Tax=Thiolapillus sp. TaxID=2017437 RepID=UPI003AF5CC42